MNKVLGLTTIEMGASGFALVNQVLGLTTTEMGNFFLYIMSGKGHMTYNKIPTKEELRKWGRLSREGDKIKLVDIRFKG